MTPLTRPRRLFQVQSFPAEHFVELGFEAGGPVGFSVPPGHEKLIPQLSHREFHFVGNGLKNGQVQVEQGFQLTEFTLRMLMH